MKIICLLIFSFFYAYSCSGDCMACHPVLKKTINSKYHLVLKSCINCHKTTPDSMSSCGGDCFSCHSQNKLIKTKLKEHQDLASCKACHVNTEDILKFDNKFGPTLLEQLEK
ncbi:MAG: hypothetical protein MJK08_00860 [Campylobacterales bacterium]|nr:hypothetical protein [Campylobacterales bacterium]NQY53476.1 hypothetical protein [Campylobacteraceae bacterium]